MNATNYSALLAVAAGRGSTRTREKWASLLGVSPRRAFDVLVEHCPPGCVVRRSMRRQIRVEPIRYNPVMVNVVCGMTAEGPVALTASEWAEALNSDNGSGIVSRLCAVVRQTGCGLRRDGDTYTVTPTPWMKRRGAEVVGA